MSFPPYTHTTTLYSWDNTLNSAIEECKKKGLKAGESLELALATCTVKLAQLLY